MNTIPHNVEAEESLLGSMMLSAVLTDAALQLVTSADFYIPKHTAIFDALVALHAAGQSCDPVTLANVLERAQQLDKVGGKNELLRIMAQTPASANIAQYAEIVVELSLCRRAIVYASDLNDAARAAAFADVVRLSTEVDARLAAPPAITAMPRDIVELVNMPSDYDWLVPRLLERGDRVILTGGEGGGKSTLLRQLAVMLACGIHPFSRSNIKALRVLHVDCENSEAQSAREYRRMFRRPIVEQAYREGQLRIEVRRQGMNITKPADARWLDGIVGRAEPDVLVIGPLYKLMIGADAKQHQEELAQATSAALDAVRVKHNCCLLIEAHSPHGDEGARAGYRPVGSSLWRRWPEFGLAIAPPAKKGNDDYELQHWRGDRDVGRDWPAILTKGSVWPWETSWSHQLDGAYAPDPEVF